MERVVAGTCLAFAFLVMASIFNPGGSHADDAAGQGTTYVSTAHEGLVSLGTIEGEGLHVLVFSTDDGPRYTVIDAEDRRELGTLLTEEQVASRFPELNLRSMNIDDSTGPIMMVDPDTNRWHD